MNRKERVAAVLAGKPADRVPMGFWLHFPSEAFHGDAAVEAHMKFFAESRTDICKVMNENLCPCGHDISSAGDWKKVRPYRRNSSFIQDQADIVKRITDRIAGDAPVVVTIHGIFASASHTLLGVPKYDTIGRYAQIYHLRTDPDSVLSAYRAIAETLTNLCEACLDAGADGIYFAALGGERDGLTDEEHAKYLAPLEIGILNETRAKSAMHFLHMCKPHVDLRRFVDYPCDVYNWGVLESGTSLAEGYDIFPGKVMMGGLDDRSPALLSGSYEEIEAEVHAILQSVDHRRFILASDCTLPADLPYDRVAMLERACESYQPVMAAV
ncbi:uroporphyrinogen decarboxylase family protein [Anaerotruncus rubiinfantis]|uniref:uroporphyrinogen decarboxylase family protein n=1 Tax=Anaerotruncus rubiinfantis TaxID=1720200 RepID=UPI0018988E50|nr:uroporphyrinogen decarboxylase family protein [Anaerotruncus rubiinfantis]